VLTIFKYRHITKPWPLAASCSTFTMHRVMLIGLLLSSCGGGQGSPSVNEVDSHLRQGPYDRFPSDDYSEVSLYYLDSALYHMNELVVMEERYMNAPYTNGLAFVDSSGNPTISKYERLRLSGEEQKELSHIFMFSKPDSVLVMTNCVPYYRDVFVFLDKKKRQVAQAQICLQCGQGYFTPDTQRLQSRFHSGIDLDELKAFISKVKAR
jgi:hypothetical protein